MRFLPLVGRFSVWVVAAACTTTGPGATNLLATHGVCDGLSMVNDPRCACCAGFVAGAVGESSDDESPVLIPACIPGLGYSESAFRTAACAPLGAALACGGRCPEGAGCYDELCEPCAAPGEACDGRVCCCPGEQDARSCNGVCECPNTEEGAGGSDLGYDRRLDGGYGGHEDAGPETDLGPAECAPESDCPLGQPLCPCIPGDLPTCERGRCVQFNATTALCVESCWLADREGGGCGALSTGLACGLATCALDFGSGGGSACAITCETASDCPIGQTCESYGDAALRICLPAVPAMKAGQQ